ncbi:MAG TPA: ABC transporter permease [Bryobacteraceae bacterium]|nr:ABC transporter permease [Bryobacteraceae bacterium]
MHDWKRLIRERIALLRLKGTVESDLAEELGAHLEDRYQELRRGGATDEEAYQEAVAELNHLHPLETNLKRSERMPKNEAVPIGDTANSNWLGDILRDVRYSGRTMRKNPLFVLFVVLTLALGIGANTTVFTIFNTLILNPLPVPKASTLAAVVMAETKAKAKSKATLPISYADLKDYQAKNEAFGSLAGYTGPRVVTWQDRGSGERMFSELVTGNYFSTLGLTPAVGRFFGPQEDSTPGANPVAVMNYATWKGRFGGESSIIGRTLRLNNVVFTVIGVAPPKFIGVNALFGPDLWIPAAMAEQLLPTEMHDAFTDRNKAVFEGVGRLKPGVTRTQADANMVGIAAALAREYPETNEGHSVAVRPISDVIFGSSSGSSTPVLFGTAGLLAVVGIVLLIACSNVANLLLARSAARRQEIAVRLAIGASRARLVRQLLTENVVIALLSGLVGVVIGYVGLQLLWSRVIPAEVVSNMIKPHMDAAVFVYAMAISVITGFLFGTVPALQASRVSVVETLKEESHTAGRSQNKVTFAKVLLVAQVAFSFLLLVTASLFLRSITRSYQIDPGFQTKNLAVFLTNPGQAGYGEAETKAFYKEVRERASTMPGVASVSWASNLPLWGRLVSGVEIGGRQPTSKSEAVTTILNTVDVNYFETAGVAIDRGREFTEMDKSNSRPVAIVNEKMVHDYWPGGDAIGKQIRLPGDTAMREIVGIARTANYSTLGEPPQACVYVPLEQNYFDAMTLYVRSKGAPEQIMIPVQREMRMIGPRIMVNDIRAGHTIIDNGLFSQKIGVGLLSVFGLLALTLASIGLYGVMAYSVNQRRREIGVRMALGAARESVLRLILKQGMSMVLTGVAVGFAASLAVGRILSRMLYGVSASDPISVLAAALVLLSVALLACYLPARWASRVDPLVALREG